MNILKRAWESMKGSNVSKDSDRVTGVVGVCAKKGIGYTISEDGNGVVIDTDVPTAIIQYTNPQSRHPDEMKTMGAGHVVIRVDAGKISAEGDGCLAMTQGYGYGYGIGGNGTIVNGNGQYGYNVGNGVG